MRVLTWIITEAAILFATVVAMWVAAQMLMPFIDRWLLSIERTLRHLVP